MAKTDEGDGRARNGVQRLAQNPWIALSERAAIYVLVVAIGFVVNALRELDQAISDSPGGLIPNVTEIRTVQQKAVLPALRAVEGDVSTIMDNLVNHPRFDKQDAQRLDDKHMSEIRRVDQNHKTRIEKIDLRLRDLEAGRIGGHQHPFNE